MQLKQRLRVELESIKYSDFQKALLKRQMKHALQNGGRKKLTERLVGFWNGYTEIPVPVLACAVGLIFAGFGAVWAHAFVVDEAVAALLLRTTVDAFGEFSIEKGVVVL